MQVSWLRVAALRQSTRELQGMRHGYVREARDAGKVSKFAIGEFVLITADVPQSELRVRWLGPLQVVSTVNGWVYVLEDIVSGKHARCCPTYEVVCGR